MCLGLFHHLNRAENQDQFQVKKKMKDDGDVCLNRAGCTLDVVLILVSRHLVLQL